MKITKLPGVDDEILLELLSKSIHTGQEFLEYTSSEELIQTLESELLTREELERIREIALEILTIEESPELTDDVDRELADHIDPDLCNTLYSLHLNTGDLPGFSKYICKEILDMPVRVFRGACGESVLSRRQFAESYSLSEKIINQLIVYIDLLETYEEDREKLLIDFTRSLFIELKKIPSADKNRVLALQEESVYTLSDFEDVLSGSSELEKMASKGYSRDMLKIDLSSIRFGELPPETPEEIKTRLSIDPLLLLYRYMDIKDDMIEEIWKNNTQPRTLKAFQEMTRTIKNREAIEKRLSIGKYGVLELMAAMADLLNIPAMTPWDAFHIYYSSKGSINSVKNLAKLEFIRDGVIQDVSAGTTPTSRVIPYIIAAREMDTGFESRSVPSESPDPDPLTSKEIIKENEEISLSEMLTQLGKGIGQAQRELDLAALEMQKEILINRDLSEYGLQPTWFTMPEIDFSLKMEYDIISTITEEGTLESRYMNITPMNAEYKSAYGISAKEESSLTIKFVPVPPIEAFVQRREVPDMTKMTVEEAKAALAEKGISAILYAALNVPPEYSTSDDKTEVTHQSIKPGEYLGIGERLFVLATYKKRVQSA